MVWRPLAGAMLMAAAMDTVAAQSATDQVRCTQAAATAFRLSGWKTEDGSAYKSRYSRTLGVCLIEMEGRSPYGVTRTVSDAVGGRMYAIYIWVTGGNKPMLCQLIPSEKEKRNCASEAEYKAFAASLMEQP